jgi:hypothetical protein
MKGMDMETSVQRNALKTMLTQTARSQAANPSCANTLSTSIDFLTHMTCLSLCCSPDELRKLFKRMHLALEDTWTFWGNSPVRGLVTTWDNEDVAATDDEFQWGKMACSELTGESTSGSNHDDFQDTQSSDGGCDIPLPMPPQVPAPPHHLL